MPRGHRFWRRILAADTRRERPREVSARSGWDGYLVLVGAEKGPVETYGSYQAFSFLCCINFREYSTRTVESSDPYVEEYILNVYIYKYDELLECHQKAIKTWRSRAIEAGKLLGANTNTNMEMHNTVSYCNLDFVY